MLPPKTNSPAPKKVQRGRIANRALLDRGKYASVLGDGNAVDAELAEIQTDLSGRKEWHGEEGCDEMPNLQTRFRLIQP